MLPAIRDTIDGLPADVAKEYVARADGRFVLQVEGVTDGDGKMELADVTRLKRALESERGLKTAAEQKAARFKDLDLDAANNALRKVEEMKNWKPAEEVENRIKLIKEELVGAHGRDKTKLETRLQRAEGQLKKTLVRDKAVMAIQKAGGKVTMLLPHVEAAMRLKENDSDQNPYMVEIVNPETGELRIGENSSNMNLEQLIGEFKANDDYAPAFASSGASGSGASGGANGGGGNGSNNGRKDVKMSGRIIQGVSLEDIAEGKINPTFG